MTAAVKVQMKRPTGHGRYSVFVNVNTDYVAPDGGSGIFWSVFYKYVTPTAFQTPFDCTQPTAQHLEIFVRH
jgi:hypothetical protein